MPSSFITRAKLAVGKTGSEETKAAAICLYDFCYLIGGKLLA